MREGSCSVENDLELAVMGRDGVDSGGDIQDRCARHGFRDN